MKTLVADGHNLLFKAYAVPFKFYSSKGTPLHVVTTFLSLIRRAAEAVSLSNGDRLVVVFDSQAPSSNHLLDPEYKENRTKDFSNAADSPFHHLGFVKQALQAVHIPSYEIDGVEAGRKVSVVIAIHPDVSAWRVEGADPIYDMGLSNGFVPNRNMLTQLYNWLQRVQPDGIMIVITVFREEAEAIVLDPRLSPMVRLYGATAVLPDFDMPNVAYVVAFKPSDREGEPIVWSREQYGAFHPAAGKHLNRDMFSGEDD